MANSKKSGSAKKAKKAKKATKPKAKPKAPAKPKLTKPKPVAPKPETAPAARPAPAPAVQPPVAPAVVASATQPSAPDGALCQSCGMPMNSPEKFGKNADRSPSADYCSLCFDSGAFRRPEMTLEQMIELVAGIMAQGMGMSPAAAKTKASSFLPQLKRWRA